MTATHVILVVDDDALVRLSACDMLDKAGHSTVEAEHADHAISILESRTDITVVFTDIDMPPGMNGVLLAGTVRDRWPLILIIATSGRVRIDDGELPDGSQFLPKPYNAGMFSKALTEIVA